MCRYRPSDPVAWTRETRSRSAPCLPHIATVATARHMIKVVYYTMRDGHARCLDAPVPATP